MAIAVLVPLHSDVTQFDADAIWSEALQGAVEALSMALGERLGRVAPGEWPELRQLYVDCTLLDESDLSAGKPRFDKKFGQFNIGCSVDCRPLIDAELDVQAAAIFDVICQAASGAFAKRKMPGLADTCEEFRAAMDEPFVRKCLANAPVHEDGEGIAFDPVPLDAEGRTRHLRELDRNPGELWLMARPHGCEIDVVDVMATIEAFVEDRQLGESTGSSVGQGAFDLSFDVDDLEAAGHALEQFLRGQLPGLDFIISDDYEPQLDEAQHE